ncbi:hypothetical protein [Cellulomonas edaphi]|uniref:Major facilitator superfamily (MFS) profile domain-containing protein n=1 Tax=Cellulomonas edaphi TaxID=3053468 RepID=A0ABT7S7W6_9CELL|nr:hypothetical protein [Cellulomons edaphi]MDM7831713.1 hypothetical protein [Cellulomons edaphi]
MAVRGPAAARRRLRRRVALVCFAVGLVAGVALVLASGGGAGGAVVSGVVVGALGAGVGALVVAFLPTSHHGPPGQH